jgi:predicted transcriptional regulator
MTSDEILLELQKVHASLTALEAGQSIATGTTTPTGAPKLSIKQAFKKDEIICLVCGKGGFKTLKKHLRQTHQLTPRQYRKQFGIPSTQSLAAKSYSESRRQMAIDSNLADGLAKAREKRAMDKDNVSMKITKAPVPAKRVKAPVPAVRVKAPVPAKTPK